MSKSDKFSKAADDYLKDVWGERSLGFSVTAIDWTKPIGHAEVAYLLSRYPYLQMINSEAQWAEAVVPRFRKARNGWVMHDYGDAMSSSPGKYLFGPGNPETKEEDEKGGGTDTGTVIKQSFVTAEAMIEWAIEKGWPGVEIVFGEQFMKWAAWMAAQDRSYSLSGYEPTQKEKEKRERIIRLRGESKAPTKGPAIIKPS